MPTCSRTAAVWNVVAAPELSLTLQDLVLPGRRLRRLPRLLRPRRGRRARPQTCAPSGLEVAVYGVPAYSTLGKLNWLGGDPLLNTFVHWPEGELARLIFHELAHQVVYAADDTMFNESFATAVERIGGARWLAAACRRRRARASTPRCDGTAPRLSRADRPLPRRARCAVPQRRQRRRQARRQGRADGASCAPSTPR